MVDITHEYIDRLIALESQVNYRTQPPVGEESFTVIDRESPILISAPHGARTFRNNSDEVWHEEDEYTAGIAQLLGEICEVSVIATVFQNNQYDPNNVRDDNVAYKQAIRSLIEDSGVKFVLDIHGAALNSPTLASNQTIDIGYRNNSNQERSMDEEHILKLEQLLEATENKCDPDCFIVGRNKFPARGRGTITTFVFCCFGFVTNHKVQSVQIELKPQIRVVQRFSTATLYKSCGEFSADPGCMIHLLQALANFINYLKDLDN